jgi:gliding motility-associated-like protein
LPTVTITPNSAEICPEHTVTLTANGANTYSWTPITGLSSNTGASVDASPQNNTTYTVIGTDNKGCSSNASATITIHEFSMLASEDKTICNGENTNIYAIPNGGVTPITYYWNNELATQNINVSPNQQTTYHVFGIDATGCKSDTAEVTISVFPNVELELYANKDTVCPGNPITITTDIHGGAGDPYTLTNQEGTIINAPIQVYPNGTQNYIFTAKDNCGSSNTDTITLTSYISESFNISSDIIAGCEPLEINFTSSANNEASSYFWKFYNNYYSEMSFEKSPKHIFKHNGIYDVSLSIIDKHGCTSTSQIKNMITVHPKPEAKFSVNNSILSNIDPTIQFYNYSSLNYNNYWSFGDGDSSISENPFHKYKNTGDFLVSLTVETNKGCKDSVFYTIKVKDEISMYVPTAFSPDNDGINDNFTIKAHGINLDKFKLIIYNRWGEIVWETNDITDSWNGLSKNNKPVEAGVYKWLIIYSDINNSELSKSGNLTLIK